MSKTQDPRIAPKEMIVTRFKSAQQRRQLRDKDRSMAKMTELLKSPQKRGRKKKSPRKEKEAKDPIIVDEDEPKEYYPEKLKRVQGQRKQFLKPKHNLTTVARPNKRKFSTPKKGVKPSQVTHDGWLEDFDPTAGGLKCQSPTYSELSMEEVIRMVEETESLDDEDLMEILTCPSPVWWEEQADEMYIEEAICTHSPEEVPVNPIKEQSLQTKQTFKHSRRKQQKKKKKEDSKEDSSNIEKDVIIDTCDYTNETNFKVKEIKDEKFVKKRRKLENVLGNIKNKAMCGKMVKSVVPPLSNTDSNERAKMTEDIITKSQEDKGVTSKHRELNNKPCETSTKDKKVKEKNTKKVKRISESTEDDIADLTADDNLLLDLENMEIPIENNEFQKSNANVIVIKDDGHKITLIEDDTHNSDENAENNNKIANPTNLDDNGEIIYKNFDNSATGEKSASDIKNEIAANNDDVINSTNLNDDAKENIKEEEKINNVIDDKSSMKLVEVPKNLPPLKKRPKFDSTSFPSPISIKSVTDDTAESSSVSSHDISDTISDTNIKFIMDEDIEDVSDIEIRNDDVEKYEMKKEALNIECKIDEVDTKSNKDYITVYKIVSNDAPEKKNLASILKSIPEYSSHVENLNKVQMKSELREDLSESKGQLNSFFKKCKNANRKRCKVSNEDANVRSDVKSLCESCEPKKSITVAQDKNMKYCLKCSSIFDTEECSYCLLSLNAVVNKNAACSVESGSKCNLVEIGGDSGNT